MKNRKEEIIKTVKGANMHFDEYEASKERKLASFNKSRENNKLYLEGYSAGLKGEYPLEYFAELILENDKVVQKKDHRNFKAGYIRGQKELEEQMSRNNKTR
jgi:hypothetical protein